MSVFVLHIGKHLGAGMALLGLFVKTVSSSVALPFPCTWWAVRLLLLCPRSPDFLADGPYGFIPDKSSCCFFPPRNLHFISFKIFWHKVLEVKICSICNSNLLFLPSICFFFIFRNQTHQRFSFLLLLLLVIWNNHFWFYRSLPLRIGFRIHEFMFLPLSAFCGFILGVFSSLVGQLSLSIVRHLSLLISAYKPIKSPLGITLNTFHSFWCIVFCLVKAGLLRFHLHTIEFAPFQVYS